MSVSGIHPKPKQFDVDGTTVSLADGVTVHARNGLEPLVERVLTPELDRAGIAYRWDDGSGYGIEIRVGDDPTEEVFHLGDEAYGISVTSTGVSVSATSERGTLYGLMTLGRMIDGDSLPCGTVVDGPDFAHRGIVEGFYGRPFSHAARLDLVEFAARLKMNIYLYGPKDDPFHRTMWRDLYDDRRIGEFAELVDRARGLGMEFGWAAAPGFTVRYGDIRDVDALVSKFMQFAEIGVRLFAIFYDDIFGGLQHVEDRKSFKSLAGAQAHFTVSVLDKLRRQVPDARLLVCPTEYWGDAESNYVVELASGVPVEIPLFWTGPNICSRAINAEGARTVAERLGRKPVCWDNYPVNDASMVFDLHVGPVVGRDAGLGTVTWGLLANPMSMAEAGKIPLFTIADYLWNSAGYAPERSWKAALQHVDPACADAWEFIFGHMQRSCLTDGDSSRLDAVIDEYNGRCAEGSPGIEPFIEYSGELTESIGRVFGDDANKNLVRDVSPWLNRLHVVRSLVTDVVAVLAMAAGKVPTDRNVIRQFRRHALQDIESLRNRFAPHVGHKALEALALRAMTVSEDILRDDGDAARRWVNEPIDMVEW